MTLPQQSTCSGTALAQSWQPEAPEVKIQSSASTGPEQKWSLAQSFCQSFASTVCQSPARAVPDLLAGRHALAARAMPELCQYWINSLWQPELRQNSPLCSCQ